MAVQTFVAGKSFEQYRGDDMLCSAVERKLEIVGEALNQLRKADPALAAQWPELAAAVGLRKCAHPGTQARNLRERTRAG